jgi:hypothetical protein
MMIKEQATRLTPLYEHDDDDDIMVKVALPLGCYRNYLVSNFVLLPIVEFANYQTPIIAPRDNHDTFVCCGK